MALDAESSDQTDPLEELVFLARSRHRIRLLTELDRTEQPRRRLHERTGISQPTLGRILADFEAREWVTNHHDGTYSLTPLGGLLADAVDGLIETIGTTAELADVVDHLPVDELAIDPRQLATASVITPSPADPLAHMRRFDELAVQADHVRAFSNVLACAPAAEPSDADLAFLGAVDELLVTAEALETGRADPALRSWLHEQIEAGVLSVCVHEGDAPFLYGLFDDVAGIVPVDEAGVPHALLETDAGGVHDWLASRFDTHRDRGTRLGAADLRD